MLARRARLRRVFLSLNSAFRTSSSSEGNLIVVELRVDSGVFKERAREGLALKFTQKPLTWF